MKKQSHVFPVAHNAASGCALESHGGPRLFAPKKGVEWTRSFPRTTPRANCARWSGWESKKQSQNIAALRGPRVVRLLRTGVRVCLPAITDGLSTLKEEWRGLPFALVEF
jgi:hypothetical protein